MTDEARALESLSRLLSRGDIAGLRALGNETGEEAFLASSPELVDLAVIAYALSKFLEKHYLSGTKKWASFSKNCQARLAAAAKSSRAGRGQECGKAVGALVDEIEDFSAQVMRFQTNVVTKARTKIATDAYAHGASLGRACAFAGVSKSVVLSYIGATKLGDKYETMKLPERLGKARKLFG